LVALPTGTGKTVISGHLLARRAAPALVLAHRDELIRQAVDKLLMVNPDFQVGVVKAEQNDVSAPVVVASVQTLARSNRLVQMCQDFRTVIVDEAHHGVADTYQRILESVGSFVPDGSLTIGFTATPERGDKIGLGQV
jgi:ATP-dependent helicase IRC3